MYENFRYLRVDDHPAYLKATYRLRHSVYCREKKFLPENDYPDRLEIDAYDSHSVHFAAIDDEDLVKGTVRLVFPVAGLSLPLYDHCTLDVPVSPTTWEVSRLAISKRYRRPAAPPRVDDAFGLTVMTMGLEEEERTQVNRLRRTVVTGLFMLMWQEARRLGAENILVAMEPTLARLLARNNIDFERVGPEVDYYGPVYPYLMNIGNFERNLAQKNPALFEKYWSGVKKP